jgi:hypothetical protein
MGRNTNLGEETALTVFGNPEDFKKLIKNHGQLCKVKQAIACPNCMGSNHGSPDLHCDICDGDGYIYTHQRRFTIVDENSPSEGKKLYPFYQPIIEVIKVQNLTSEIQGGITDLDVESFSDSEIILTENVVKYEKKRVTYKFDGWTYVAQEKLVVDAANKLMYTAGTLYNLEYQSSNPLNAFADIAKIVRIWNIDTGVELTNYTVEGKTIISSQPVVADKMYAEYYYADLTKVITTDIMSKNNNEVFTHDLSSGECKMAFFPYIDISRGDIIVIAATVLYKNEILNHTKDIDKLYEIEIFELNDVILDNLGNKYYINTDYILQGRHIKWIGGKPKIGASISIRYAYKPAYIVFEDNPQPLSLENKIYPKTVLSKSWSKISKDDIKQLMSV